MPRAPHATKQQPQRKSQPAALLARVAFTGELASITRKEARDLVHAAGGQTVSTVSKLTTMVVVGMDGWPLQPSGDIPGKLQKAEQLRAAGAPLHIASEEEFLEHVGLRERRPKLRKAYSAEQICRLISIDANTLARWESLGLVRSNQGSYDFQDIVSLRTIAELVHAGVKPAVISRSIHRLASVLPGTDRPLAQLKLVIEQGDNGGLLAEIEGALVSPDGQIVLNFDQPEPPASHSPRPPRNPADPPPLAEEIAHGAPARSVSISVSHTLPLRDPEESQLASADDWLERGCELEETEEYDLALDAFRRAVTLRPHFAEAHFNLANVLLAQNRREAAEERFRVALEQDRTLAAAWYNLANLQESAGRINEAIFSLKQAINVAPTYADAHFNLASAYEQVGQLANARHHWEQYVKLDPSSEWAAMARKKLDE